MLTGFDSRLVVGVGGLAVSNNESVVLTTYSLGSCLGVTLYDPVTRAGGLLHAMLPESSINLEKAREQPAMFVDTGISALFRAVYELRGEKHRMQICVAGGAQFLDSSGLFNIGQRNISCLSKILRQHQLDVHAQDVGGTASRTIHLHLSDGAVRMKRSIDPAEVYLTNGYANIG
jgi:chemotaxis protein CheD